MSKFENLKVLIDQYATTRASYLSNLCSREEAEEKAAEIYDELDSLRSERAALLDDQEELTKVKAELTAIRALEPVGYMHAGHVYELQQKRANYGYVYPANCVGADTAVYALPEKQK